MKTTNFFIDFIIIGIIASATIIIPIIMIDNSIFDMLYDINTKDKIYFLPLVTIVIYIVGVTFNQLSDEIIKKFIPVFKLKVLDASEGSIKVEIGKSYHECLQKIVFCSKSAYEYLSYRRSVIRIIRSLFIFCVLTIIIYLILLFIIFFFNNLKFSKFNLLILFSLIIGIPFFRKWFIKLQIGYYSAIKNFYKIIDLNDGIKQDELNKD